MPSNLDNVLLDSLLVRLVFPAAVVGLALLAEASDWGLLRAPGIPAELVLVLIFKILLNGSATFNHGNVRLPAQIDRVLSWLMVMPDMHRVHHSIVPRETNSNFGFNLPR